jgi:recombinational DNA repair ATPase RecF
VIQANYKNEQRTVVSIWTHKIPQAGKKVNRVRDDFQQRLGQEAAPKHTSVQWEHNSLQRVTEKNWKVINQKVAVRIVRRISWHITSQVVR